MATRPAKQKKRCAHWALGGGPPCSPSSTRDDVHPQKKLAMDSIVTTRWTVTLTEPQQRYHGQHPARWTCGHPSNPEA